MEVKLFYQLKGEFMALYSKLLTIGLVAVSVFLPQVQAKNQNSSGYTVNVCSPVENDEPEMRKNELNRNFCSKSAVGVYKKFSAKDINFANKYVLIKMYGNSFVALEPSKRNVFVLPYVISDSMDENKAGRITFKKNSNLVCSYGENTHFIPYSSELIDGDSSNAGFKLCIEFSDKTGFDDYFYPYDKKTNKPVSRL